MKFSLRFKDFSQSYINYIDCGTYSVNIYCCHLSFLSNKVGRCPGAALCIIYEPEKDIWGGQNSCSTMKDFRKCL